MSENKLPLLYHSHHSLHAEDLPFWLSLARQQGAPVLELGCGTGRILLALAQAGFSMFGLDLDMDMLTFLRKRLNPGLIFYARLFQADMRQFCLARQFPLITLPCNTYSIFNDYDRQAILRQVYTHLAPGGLFVTSLPNAHMLRQLPQMSEAEVEESFYHPNSGEPVQVSSAWKRNRKAFIVYWHYDLMHSNGEVERISFQARHLLTPLDVLKAEFQSAGLVDLTIWGDYDFSPYNPDGDILILSGRKP